MWLLVGAIVPVVMWLGLLLVPWHPWSTREHLEADPPACVGLDDVTVLIPARNEADVIGTTLRALQAQGNGLQVIVIDDQSADSTASVASSYPGVRVISGAPLPEGWAGKLWALEQGRLQVRTPLTLLLDADIELRPGMLATLLLHKQREQRQFVSIMADLRRTSFWDRLLLPAFVYYFKLLYPFALSNSPSRWVAAGAGGCILVDTAMLDRIGGFGRLRDALIDDCALARQVKRAGGRTWIGLSRDVVSLRPYGSFASIHGMVARSAFTQLGYSTTVLLLVTVLFLWAYGVPLVLLGAPQLWPWAWLALGAMMLGYLPMLRYYRMPLWWALLLPLGAGLYLGMTWSSALRYWRGVRSQWKGRVYRADA
ncbi:glycosyltransferase [Dyella japonica]|uniref:Glycosyl transferase n=1 Tax=Dyella japonica DSM 16301 TaxID=1440762 RepID=A0A0G9H5K6_9GAMM|nr:glycosyltransferase [Dyella japonica]KLD64858.1 glycosyl transferase [Dyella japonica DSM 16301]